MNPRPPTAVGIPILVTAGTLVMMLLNRREDIITTAITTIVARFNAISQGLSTAPDRHAPIFRKTDDGQALPHLWCRERAMESRHRLRDRRDLRRKV